MKGEEQLKNLPYLNKSTLEDVLEKRGENLNYWVKKLLAQGELVSLKKGLYVSKLYLLGLEKNPALREDYLEYLANIIRYPSYLSLEYVMAKYGLIPEAVFNITSVTTKSSRTYKNPLGNFIYRHLKEELFFGFEYVEYEDKKVRVASKAKAIFDFLYFKKFASRALLKDDLIQGLRINWDAFSLKDQKEFEKAVESTSISKMKSILKTLVKEGVFSI